jgi:hypothetical protein
VVCGLWCVVCGVWCVVCGVVSGVWCVVCGVWCEVCGVWRVACGVWRVACGVWSATLEFPVCGVQCEVLLFRGFLCATPSVWNFPYKIGKVTELESPQNRCSAGSHFTCRPSRGWPTTGQQQILS